MNSPKLIIFEGVDAAGKSTVCANYLQLLTKNGVAAKLLSFPGKTPRTLGQLVYELHHDPLSRGIDHLTPSSLQALHIAAHLDCIETVIIPSLMAGETVILDRYWWSTWVYGIIGGADPKVLSKLIDAERLIWGKWQPDLVFHVTRSTPLRNEPIATWEKLRQEYDFIAKNEANNYPVCILSNDGELEHTVSMAFTESHGH